jgi:hypothetical protein
MPKSRKPAAYTTYILRCWQEGSSWRYSLEEVGGGERHGFASLDELIAFLLARRSPRGAAGRAVRNAPEKAAPSNEVVAPAGRDSTRPHKSKGDVA